MSGGAHGGGLKRRRSCFFRDRPFASNALDLIRPPLLDDEEPTAISSQSDPSDEFEPTTDPNEPSGECSSTSFSIRVLDSLKSAQISTPEIGSRPSRPYLSDFNKLMKAFSRGGAIEEVLRLFNELKGSECSPNVLCYNTVINALVIADRPREAQAMFDEMLLSGVAPNVSSYNILVKLHSWCSKQFDLAYEGGENWGGMGVLDWMLEEKCRPTVHTYTPIVLSYCSEGQIEEAKTLMAAMESVGCRPNTVTYNILIRALCNAGRFDEVEQVLVESEFKGWTPNSVTYNTYMSGLCKRSMGREALGQLEKMLSLGLHPTIFTLSILLDCLCCCSMIWEAKCLLERSSAVELYIGVVGYNTVMSRLIEIGRWQAVLKLMIDMIKKGVTPNTRTFNIVIHSLCIAGKSHLAKFLIRNRGFVANVVTYNTLIHWFYLEGKFNEVQLLISDMTIEKIAPDLVTYTIIIDGLCRQGKFSEATDCFKKSLENGLCIDLFVGLMNRLVKSRRIKEILSLFKQIEGQGFYSDVIIYDSTVQAFCRHGYCSSADIFILCLILDKMLVKKLLYDESGLGKGMQAGTTIEDHMQFTVAPVHAAILLANTIVAFFSWTSKNLAVAIGYLWNLLTE
uniref:Pentatricopeptide repeat-containing protein n=1 Tax=Ananas comosus var. bracteatus TaxID=296719 RepID=A0A6V7Q1K6_ANACO|nr:unnamed protein product [Ananas comosus var. bracteatus]